MARARLPTVSHPSLGLPPLDLTAGFPDAAARIRSSAERLGARALMDETARAYRDAHPELQNIVTFFSDEGEKYLNDYFIDI